MLIVMVQSFEDLCILHLASDIRYGFYYQVGYNETVNQVAESSSGCSEIQILSQCIRVTVACVRNNDVQN